MIKKDGIIYNLNTATITNTNFTKITGRLINNSGNLRFENSNVNDIYGDGIYVNINTTTREYAIEYNKTKDGIVIYNTNELIFKNSTIKNINYNTDWRIVSKIQSENGPIYNSGKATIQDSLFENIGVVPNDYGNYLAMKNGGVIANYGTLNFINNTAIKTYGTYGGVIYNKGNATVDSFKNTLSSAETYGHSIYNDGKITIKNSTFYNIRYVFLGNWYGGNNI